MGKNKDCKIVGMSENSQYVIICKHVQRNSKIVTPLRLSIVSKPFKPVRTFIEFFTEGLLDQYLVTTTG